MAQTHRVINATIFKSVNNAAFQPKIEKIFSKFQFVDCFFFVLNVDKNKFNEPNVYQLKSKMTSLKDCNQIWNLFSKILESTVPASFTGSPGTSPLILTFNCILIFSFNDAERASECMIANVLREIDDCLSFQVEENLKEVLNLDEIILI